MKLFSSKKRLFVAAALVVLALFLLRPGASRLKSRIIRSISSAVGRPVDIGSVHIMLLPRPGFDLENLVVYEDPAFGAEPMLRASEVTAALRLTSLFRGRLEIARLDLNEPSLNLVRAAGGGWNLERLLERTRQFPLAPTAKAKSEPRPAFPYIEGSSARINFKNGPEKKPYALTSADFSLWQDSENSWGVRLKAQPVRTDVNLNDTGLLLVSGTWGRAANLRDSPLQFNVEWSHAQVGQVTKLVTRNDQGWRGEILLDVALSGTPANLQVVTNASIQDFRRYDITSGQALRLATHCAAQYSSTDQVFHDLLCSAPAAGGLISLRGDLGLPATHRLDLALSVEKVPASAVAVLVERAKKNLPQDLVAGGTVLANIRILEKDVANTGVLVDGRGEVNDFQLSSATGKAEIGPETIPFVVTSQTQSPAMRRSIVTIADGPQMQVGPFALAVGRSSAPATVRGSIDRRGYSFSVAGDADIAKTLRVARMLGIPALQTASDGLAQVDLQVAGTFTGDTSGSGFAGPRVTGTAKLRSSHVLVRGVAGPIDVASAEVQLLADSVRVAKLNAKTADVLWTGSLEMPRGCSTPDACEIHFALNASEISLREMKDWVSPSPKVKPWYRVLESESQAPSFLAMLRASGRLKADRMQVQNLAATNVSANLRLDQGKLQISDLRADLLGGKHQGSWQADFTSAAGACTGTGTLSAISLTRLADLTKRRGMTGTATANYELKGSCPADFWPSAEGTVKFDLSNGMLPRLSIGETPAPLSATRLAGQARLHAGEIELKNTALISPGGKFDVTGTASITGELNLKLARSSGSGAPSVYAVTGTMAEPRVAPIASNETQAKLKTDPAK